MFPSIVPTHTYDDRVATARLAIDAGMELCCGGILGMGETLEQRVDFAFELAELEPCEVPINFLLPTGTPLGDQRLITPREALQAIALFRLVLPGAWLRLTSHQYGFDCRKIYSECVQQRARCTSLWHGRSRAIPCGWQHRVSRPC